MEFFFFFFKFGVRRFVPETIDIIGEKSDSVLKENVYRMFAVMTDEVGQTFNWSGKHGWRGCGNKDSKV